MGVIEESHSVFSKLTAPLFYRIPLKVECVIVLRVIDVGLAWIAG